MAARSTKRGKAKASGKSGAKSLAPRNAASVKGGSLNTYTESVTGEKQGKYKVGK